MVSGYRLTFGPSAVNLKNVRIFAVRGISETQAAQVLAAVLERLPAADEDNGGFHVLDSWTEGDDTICLVYRGWWHGGTLGLRRRIDADLPLDIVVGQILGAELGEPPGLLVEAVAPDSSGITWWHGEPPGWWRRPGATEA